MPISSADFASGGLSRDSNVRVCHLFTLDPKGIDYKAGALKPEKVQEVIASIIKILDA